MIGTLDMTYTTQDQSSSGYQPILPDNLGPWTQEEAIRYEVAEELFGNLVAYCSAEIAEAEAAGDTAGAERWSLEQAEWARRQDALPGTPDDEIKGILATYGPIVRARYDEIRRRLGVPVDSAIA